MNHCVRIPYYIVYHNVLQSLQHICSLPKHDALNLLHTNFQHKNCQFSLIALTLCRCWKTPRLLPKLQIFGHLLENYCRQLQLSIYHLPYRIPLEHLLKTEACKKEVVQFKANASSVNCQSDLNS